jgi:hypothetical protein
MAFRHTWSVVDSPVGVVSKAAWMSSEEPRGNKAAHQVSGVAESQHVITRSARLFYVLRAFAGLHKSLRHTTYHTLSWQMALSGFKDNAIWQEKQIWFSSL